MIISGTSTKIVAHTYTYTEKKEQVTRGHNIVADGWAGASNPHLQPNPSPTLKHTKNIENARFPTFQLDDLRRTDGPMDQRTDGRTKALIELRVRN